MQSKHLEARMYQLLSTAVKRGSAAGLCSTPVGEKIYLFKNITAKTAMGACCGDYAITVEGKWKVRGQEKPVPYPVVVEK